jgi:FAD/FMN-containing dehydrogenase
MAVLVGAGIQASELRNLASAYNITVGAPGGGTVGVAGGWIASGGHGALSSKIGLGSDQVLSINVVTADGQFLTADPNTNHDLWWALRGGGPSKSPTPDHIPLISPANLFQARMALSRPS